MKRLIGFLLILVLLISLASCGNIDLSKDGKKEIINNAWKRLGADTIMKFNEDGTGEYDSFKITKWSYEGVFLDFSYEDTFLEYNVDKEFKLLYDSNNILTLTCEDDENIVFVKESQYDEASKTFEIKKEEVASSNDDESSSVLSVKSATIGVGSNDTKDFAKYNSVTLDNGFLTCEFTTKMNSENYHLANVWAFTDTDFTEEYTKGHIYNSEKEINKSYFNIVNEEQDFYIGEEKTWKACFDLSESSIWGEKPTEIVFLLKKDKTDDTSDSIYYALRDIEWE